MIRRSRPTIVWLVAAASLALSACGSSSSGDGAAPGGDAGGTAGTSGSSTGGQTGNPGGATASGGATMASGGQPAAVCDVPAGAEAEDISQPTTVVGDGTAASCTADAVAAAVHAGGVVTFSCGSAPLAIIVPELDIFNDGGKGDGSVTIDGGGLITLSGGGKNRVLYQNTCDQTQHWTSSHCQAQDTPHLVLQNITFADGVGDAEKTRGLLGGGAIYAGGGTFKAINLKVINSSQPTLGQDNAGGAIYTFNQTAPVTLVGCTFTGNSASSGGALGSIATSWTIVNGLFDTNATKGSGENPAKPGSPGGGLGGAIYNDGNGYTLSICGTTFTGNTAAELGSGSIFQVVDDLKGALDIDRSTFTGNSNEGSVQSSSHPSIYVEATDKAGNGGVNITNTTFM